MCQIRTHAVSSATSQKCHRHRFSFDHLVGAGEERRGDFEAKRFGVLRLVISSSSVGYHTAAFRRLVLASRVGHAFVTRRDAKFTAAGLRAV
jgi:hypothetical protein